MKGETVVPDKSLAGPDEERTVAQITAGLAGRGNIVHYTATRHSGNFQFFHFKDSHLEKLFCRGAAVRKVPVEPRLGEM